MEPEAPGAKRRGRARLPKLEAGEAIRVYAINENAKTRGPARRGGLSSRDGRPEKTHEELVQELAMRLTKLREQLDRKRAGEGWTEAADGLWLPPGWTAEGPEWPPLAEESSGC